MWRTLDPEEAQRCPDIISRTNAPTAADNPQTSSNDDPQQPDAVILDATKDEFDVVTDSDDEIVDVVTQNSTAAAANADAEHSQHDSAADADDELDATPMHSMGSLIQWGGFVPAISEPITHGCEGSIVGAIPIEEGMTQKTARFKLLIMRNGARPM